MLHVSAKAVVQIRQQGLPSTNSGLGAKTPPVPRRRPKALQFSMLFHQISLSPQHLDLRSIIENASCNISHFVTCSNKPCNVM